MRELRIPFHENVDDCLDPAYWLDWAQDDLAYGLLAEVLACGATPDRLEAVATGFRRCLAASAGFVRVVEACPPPEALERALRAWQRIFVARLLPEVSTGPGSASENLRCQVDTLLADRANPQERRAIADELAAALLNESGSPARSEGRALQVAPARRALRA